MPEHQRRFVTAHRGRIILARLLLYADQAIRRYTQRFGLHRRWTRVHWLLGYAAVTARLVPTRLMIEPRTIRRHWQRFAKRVRRTWYDPRVRFHRLLRLLAVTLACATVVAAAFCTVWVTVGTYHANSGSISFPREGQRPAFSVPFSCGAVTPSNPFYGTGMAVYHGEPEPMQAIHNYGPVRVQISTNVSTFDLEEAATRHNAKDITQSALQSDCGGYVTHAWIRLELLMLFYAVCGGIIGRRHLNWTLPMLASFVLLTHFTWIVSLNQAENGVKELKKAHSLEEVFSYKEFRTLPAAVGPVNPHVLIEVGQSSIMSAWNGSPVKTNPSPTDVICLRSRSDVAAHIEQLEQVSVLDTSCPGADLTSGILEPELRKGHRIPAQLGLIESAPNLQYIVLDPGPNQAGWGMFIEAAARNKASIPLLPVMIANAIDDMRPAMGDLVTRLRWLHEHQPGHPQVILVGVYQPFRVGQSCAAAKGFDDSEKTLINGASGTLNQFLRQTAQDNRGFMTFVQPKLTPLCGKNVTGNGSDIMGVSSPYFMHPTPAGVAKLAAEIDEFIHLDLSRPIGKLDPAPTPGPLGTQNPLQAIIRAPPAHR